LFKPWTRIDLLLEGVSPPKATPNEFFGVLLAGDKGMSSSNNLS